MTKKNKVPKKTISTRVWIVNLFLASLFIYFLYYLDSVPETPDRTNNPKPKATPIVSTPPPVEKRTKTGPEFTFYDSLPKTEVKAPKVAAYQPKKLPENVSYLLQTGSFRSQSDAERQRANIAFQGLKAEIKQFNQTNSGIWYRVQIGPYKSRSKMNSAIDRLVSINIQPLVKKQVEDTH